MFTGVVVLIVFIVIWVLGFLIFLNKDKFKKRKEIQEPKTEKEKNQNKFAPTTAENNDYAVNIVYKDNYIDVTEFCDLIIKEKKLLNPFKKPTSSEASEFMEKDKLAIKETRLSEINLKQYIKINQLVNN